MNWKYKMFNVNDTTYFFCVEDFEIVKVLNNENIEIALKRLIAKKESISPLVVEDTNKNGSFSANNNSIDAIGIELTKGCNLDCTYCYVSASKKNKRYLNEERFIDIIGFLKNGEYKPSVLYFTGGGEPSLNYSLLGRIPGICKQYGFDNLEYDITTNGTILTNEMIEFFKNNNVKLNVSFDGNEKIHNSSRIYKNGLGSFSDVFNNLLILKDNKVNFVCKTVLQPDNNNLIDVFTFFEEKKIEFKFDLALRSFDSNYLPNIDDLNIFNDQMDNIIEYYRIRIVNNYKIYSTKILNDLKRIHYGITNEIACGASIFGFFIDIEGDIYPCSAHTSSKNLSIGNIYKGINRENITQNKFYAQSVENNIYCNNCWMKYLCSGGCFAEKWLENNNTEEPYDYLCRGFDIYWNAIIKLYIQVHPSIISGYNLNFSYNETSSAEKKVNS